MHFQLRESLVQKSKHGMVKGIKLSKDQFRRVFFGNIPFWKKFCLTPGVPPLQKTLFGAIGSAKNCLLRKTHNKEYLFFTDFNCLQLK